LIDDFKLSLVYIAEEMLTEPLKGINYTAGKLIYT
jgi:hypothetical protein